MFLQSGRNNWKLNLNDNTIYNTDQNMMCFGENLTSEGLTLSKGQPKAGRRLQKQEVATGGEPRGSGCQQSLLHLGSRQHGASPATWGWQGARLTFLGTNVTSILQKNVTQKQLALGILFPEVPPTRSPHRTPIPKPQGVGCSLLYLNGCCLLVLLINRYRVEVKRTEQAASTQKHGGGDTFG